ncbi:MAG: Eco57I restriction-modification methylase domain-containing protein [Arcobacteraceae bacterium]|nr:Eco57I restriction-modification methylase domain-containing protein [Arcobacteraceae bacterium]
MFQKSVLRSVSQDENLIALRWAKYQDYLSKIEAIKGFKEEVYQDGFLQDIFENCLGYTLKTTNPDNFNLEREKKNETDGKKADGVICVDDKIVGIIELKAQDTKNLDKVEAQAFGYLSKHSFSKYVIISNFDELRFYFDKAVNYEKFSLFNLDYDEFKKLHLILSYESIKDDIPLKLKEKSANFEQEISKQLYKDFSTFRTHIFENLIKNNDMDKSLLLRLTQKLCDRIIFILFAEDRGLLTANTIKEIRQRHEADVFGNSMYEYYKIYFDAINQGNEKLNIPKYNGGLFATDEELNSLIIDDNILDMEAQKLSNYDFDSEVGVNILGHIFEQSLTDLEEINASINDTDFDIKKSKRKKDGVFYTPEYITKYIVDNTLGKLCHDKRVELKLEEIKTPKNLRKLTKTEQTIKNNLEEYKNWILNLKILDPACGSGAFLNQALDFLIKEHKRLQNDLALMGDLFSSYEVEKSVLENNLYGVDINEDAVEIAKLSLWLRTAVKGRELTKLANKIKCGNSLIDDKSVVDNAFVWEDEFSEVFEQGGFDVVIGNPPYGADLIGKEWLKNKFKDTSFGTIDSYKFFTQKAIELLNNNQVLGFIMPDSYLGKEYFKDLRTLTVDSFQDITNIKLGDDIFEDVNLPTAIIILRNKGSNSNMFKFSDISYKTDKELELNNNNFILDIPNYIDTFVIKHSIIKDINNKKLIDIYNQVMGVKVYQKGKGKPKQTAYEKDNDVFVSKVRFNKDNYKYISQGIERYFYNNQNEYIKYGEWLAEPRNKIYFDSEKIIIREIINPRVFATYIKEPAVIKNISAVIIKKDDNFSIKYLLALMNSKLMTYYINEQSPKSDNKTYPSFNSKLIKNIPIKNILLENQEPFVTNVDLIMTLISNLFETKQNFINELELDKIPKKLQNFEELDFDEFVKEYKKAKKLKFVDKLEERNFKNDWKALFENDSKITLNLKSQIDTIDKEIDNMVYELYGLSDDEIKIVEGV